MSTQPRDYVPKTASARSAQEVVTSSSALGLAHPVAQLEGFLLLANTRNHCYANSSLQCIYWLLPSIRDSLMQGGAESQPVGTDNPGAYFLGAYHLWLVV